MFSHDTQVYASLRILTHVTHGMHDYSDLLMLRNEYAMITQGLHSDTAIITHI